MEPIKLQKIDESLLSEYYCLEETDHCYFMGEYAARQGFDHINPNQAIENMNQVINNFKKPVERKDKPEWRYKENAIFEIASWIISTTSWDKLKTATWIPIPPSKTKSDSHHDDRLLRVLLKMKKTKLLWIYANYCWQNQAEKQHTIQMRTGQKFKIILKILFLMKNLKHLNHGQ